MVLASAVLFVAGANFAKAQSVEFRSELEGKLHDFAYVDSGIISL